MTLRGPWDVLKADLTFWVPLSGEKSLDSPEFEKQFYGPFWSKSSSLNLTFVFLTLFMFIAAVPGGLKTGLKLKSLF